MKMHVEIVRNIKFGAKYLLEEEKKVCDRKNC
jgi:hypothetical protein